MTIHTHTPTPYTIEADTERITITGRDGCEVIACCFTHRNAAFIVRACNAHYALVEALEMLLQDCKEKGRSASYWQAESALKLARGE